MPIVSDPDVAVREIGSGDCVGIGGSVNAGHPMALVRALVRAQATDLTLVGLTGGLELDLLVAVGAASRMSAAYIGAEDVVGLPPAVRWAAEEGRLEVWESEEGIHLASLRARAQRQPYVTWTGAMGTSCEEHPLVERAVDKTTGSHYLKVRPLAVDVALLWAEAADEEGNLLLWGPDLGDEALRCAAQTRIVQVERILPTSVLSRHPDRVVPWGADIVVAAPLSTHPFTGTSLRADQEWLKLYCDAVRQARESGDAGALSTFVRGWADGDEDAYLGRIGVGRLRELMSW